MASCQSYQWAAQYPSTVDAILPFCASAKTSPHNIVFLEGVPNAELRPFDTPWGHCVTNPGNEPAFERFLDDCISELLEKRQDA